MLRFAVRQNQIFIFWCWYVFPPQWHAAGSTTSTISFLQLGQMLRTCSVWWCILHCCGRTKPASPGDKERFGRNSGNTWSIQNTHSNCVRWHGAHSPTDQNVSAEGESAPRGLFARLDIHVLRRADSTGAWCKPGELQGLPEEVFIEPSVSPSQLLAVLSLSCTINTNTGTLHLLSAVWASWVNSACGCLAVMFSYPHSIFCASEWRAMSSLCKWKLWMFRALSEKAANLTKTAKRSLVVPKASLTQNLLKH